MTKDPAWAKYENRELVITRKTAPKFENWAAEMGALNKLHEVGGFYRGDLYLAGEQWFGESKATSIFDPQKWNISTWLNNASVCRRIPPSLRSELLSYTHHAVVAYLDPEDIKRYLRIAEETQLSSRQLAELVKQDGKTVKGKEKSLSKFLKQQADKLVERIWEADGDVQELMRTAAHSLMDAYEIERDNAGMEKAA